jgi:RNase_H superfamily
MPSYTWAGVLVDLYPVVCKSIRVGAESYGLKAIEPLYLGRRQGEVTSGADSITEYARYCELRDHGCAQEAAQVLNSIAEYKTLDCRSTHGLRDWLLTPVFEPGITDLTGPVVPPIQKCADRGLAGWALGRPPLESAHGQDAGSPP